MALRYDTQCPPLDVGDGKHNLKYEVKKGEQTCRNPHSWIQFMKRNAKQNPRWSIGKMSTEYKKEKKRSDAISEEKKLTWTTDNLGTRRRTLNRGRGDYMRNEIADTPPRRKLCQHLADRMLIARPWNSVATRRRIIA